MTEARSNRRRFSAGDCIAAATFVVLVATIVFGAGALSGKLDSIASQVGEIKTSLNQSVSDLRGEIGRQAARIDSLYAPPARGP